MYTVALIMKYLINFSERIYNGIKNTFSWCCSYPSPYKFPPFCPDYLNEDLLLKKNDANRLEEVVVEQPQPLNDHTNVNETADFVENKVEHENENEWDIISDNST